MQQAVGVFADVSNVYSGVKKKYPNKKLSYERYLDLCSAYGPIYRAVAYGLEFGNEAMSFKVALKRIGYEIKYKRLTSTTAEGLKRASWNVGLAMDVVRLIDKLDVVILGSNDAALGDLVRFIIERSRKCVVFACLIQTDLKEACSQYIEIEDHLMEVESDEDTAAAK